MRTGREVKNWDGEQEVYRWGAFPDQYCGRIYGHGPGATEIVSMGMQFLYDDAAAFYKNDPEYFLFMMDIIHNPEG